MSMVLLIRKQVFSKGPLLNAPQRTNRLRLWHAVWVVWMVFLTTLAGKLCFAYYFAHYFENVTLEALHPSFWIIDATSRIVAVVLILFFAASTFTGGLSGIGLKSGKDIPLGITMGIGALALAYPLVSFGEYIYVQLDYYFRHHLPPENALLKAMRNHPSPIVLILMIVSICILAPISEELFFRGLVQSYVAQRFANFRRRRDRRAATRHNLLFAPLEPKKQTMTQSSATMQPTDIADVALHHQTAPIIIVPAAILPVDRWVAMIFTSVFFALAHGEPSETVALFLLAMALGYVYERTGNLWANITMHSVFNSVSVAVTMLMRRHP